MPMSSPVKRGAPDDEPRSSPSVSRLRIGNTGPCGDPRCEIGTCLKGPFTTLYFYPPFSRAEIVAEASIPILFSSLLLPAL